MTKRLIQAALAFGMLTGVVWAQTPPPTRVRGTIAALAGTMMTVNSRDGQKLEIALADNVTVSTVKQLPLSGVAAGSYIGTATRTGVDGRPEAIEVLVFPDAMRGAGEGHYAWDLEPGSMMTNGTIDGVAEVAAGRDLKISYKGETISVHVPPAAPVVTFERGDKDDLKPGAAVFLAATRNADGHLSAARVTVGKNGVVPPM